MEPTKSVFQLISNSSDVTNTEVIETQKETNDLLVGPLVLFAFIGLSCLGAFIARKMSTKLKQLCGFRLSRSESAKQSKQCSKEEDDY